MVGIYKITSPTNKIYIGQSWDVCKRKNHYSRKDCKGQKKLYSSISYHGWDKHVFEVIHELPFDVTQNIMNNYEIFYWKQYMDSGCEMMNIREPGSNGKLSEETREKISNSSKGKKKSNETKSKMSKAQLGNKKALGKPRSEEVKNIISKNLKGRKFSEEHKKRLSESRMNLSDESRKNISEAQKGNKNCLGRILSDETKRKIGESRKITNRIKKESK